MTNIEWTDKTWNPVRGCSKVSAGCKNCYAETMAKRLRAMGQRGYLNVIDGRGRWTGVFETDPSRLSEPLGWRKPARVFVNSMSDLFGEGVPFEFIAAVFGVMAATPRHTYQVLTKRPARMLEFFAWLERREPGRPRLEVVYQALRSEQDATAERGAPQPLHTKHCADPDGPWPLPNVWLGVSVENQAAADERIPLLLQAPAAVRFLSCEPLLGPVDLAFAAFNGADSFGMPGLGWAIVGGESGPGARPCDLAWVRLLVQQCSKAGVPVFVKQLGAWPMWPQHPSDVDMDRDRLYLLDRKGGDPSEWPADLCVRQWPREAT